MHGDMAYEQRTECPQEDGRKMSLYYMIPEMFLYEVLFRRGDKEERYQAEEGEKDIQPSFAQYIE